MGSLPAKDAFHGLCGAAMGSTQGKKHLLKEILFSMRTRKKRSSTPQGSMSQQMSRPKQHSRDGTHRSYSVMIRRNMSSTPQGTMFQPEMRLKKLLRNGPQTRATHDKLAPGGEQ